MKIVVVEWLDSGGIVDMWSFKDEELPTVRVCSTVGYLVSKNRLEVVLAQSENEEQWGRLITIPSKSVTKLKYFEEKIMKTVRDEQAKIVQVATTNARTIIYNLINVYQPYPKLITEHKEAIDQALKEIHDLIVESLPEEKVLKSRQTGQDMKQIMALGYHQALSDTKANLKRILK